VDISVTVCVFVFLMCVCTVTDFSVLDQANGGVIFYTAVHRRPRQGISHFGELCSHRSPKSDESASARATLYSHVNITVEMRRRKRHARDEPFVKSRGVWTQDRHVWI